MPSEVEHAAQAGGDAMSIIGTVAYTNPTYGIALVTPANKARDHDIFCREIWFRVGGVGEPFVGQVIELEVGRTPEGDLEGMFVRNPRLQPPPAGMKNLEPEAGAEPAAVPLHTAAGSDLEAR